jgi:RND family efflux transporter MFP subunit
MKQQNITYMRYALIIAGMVFLSACGSGTKDANADLQEKKAALEKLKKEQTLMNEKIATLQEEINKLDTSSNNETAKLVTVTTLAAQDFVHYIDLQGKIDADNISYVAPRGNPGLVKAVYVKKGEMVKAGQLLLKLDDAVIRQQIQNTNTQLLLAKDIYRRQKNLWDQGIGAEVQLINAKNAVDQAENGLKLLNEQLRMTSVYADVSGIADQVNIKVGEIFQGYAGNVPQIMIVNTNTLKVVAEIPENYASRVKLGSKMLVSLPDIGKEYNNVTVSFVSKTINANNRSFTVEGRLPYDGLIRPNQIARVRIEDYSAKNAIAVSVNTVGTDDKGKYVYIAVKEGNKLVARKRPVVIGELNGQLIEVKSGLAAGDQLITDGYQNLYDGQTLSLDTK